MTKIGEKIIKLLADHPEQKFYGQEIADKIKASKAAVSGLLKALFKQGLILREVKGHMKFYQINPKSLSVKKYRIALAIEKTSPLIPRLKKYCKEIVLFGSASRGEQTKDSDVDLFILTQDKAEARKILNSMKGSIIKAIIKTPSEWSELETKEPEFYQEIKNGITLYEHVPRI